MMFYVLFCMYFQMLYVFIMAHMLWYVALVQPIYLIVPINITYRLDIEKNSCRFIFC